MNVQIEARGVYTNVIASVGDSNVCFLFHLGVPKTATMTFITGPFVSVHYFDSFHRDGVYIRLCYDCKKCVSHTHVLATPALIEALNSVGLSQ